MCPTVSHSLQPWNMACKTYPLKSPHTPVPLSLITNSFPQVKPLSIFSGALIRAFTGLHTFLTIEGLDSEFEYFTQTLEMPSFEMFCFHQMTHFLYKLKLQTDDLSTGTPFERLQQLIIRGASLNYIFFSLTQGKTHLPKSLGS